MCDVRGSLALPTVISHHTSVQRCHCCVNDDIGVCIIDIAVLACVKSKCGCFELNRNCRQSLALLMFAYCGHPAAALRL